MTLKVDFYFSFRSPYSYLAIPQVEALIARHTFRIAQRLGIPYAWPKPDPIVMDISSGEVAAD